MQAPPSAPSALPGPLASLPEQERDMLALIALANACLTRTATASLFRAARIRLVSARNLSTTDIQPFLARWEKAGILYDPSRSSVEHALVIPPLRLPLLADAHARGRLGHLHAAARADFPMSERWISPTDRLARYVTEVRVALIREDAAQARHLIEELAQTVQDLRRGEMLLEALSITPLPGFIELLDPKDQHAYMRSVLDLSLDGLAPLSRTVSEAAHGACDTALDARLALLELFAHGKGPALERAQARDDVDSRGVQVVELALRGDYAAANAMGALAFASMTKRKYKSLTGIPGVFHALSTFSSHGAKHAIPGADIATILSAADKARAGHATEYEELSLLLSHVRGSHKTRELQIRAANRSSGHWLEPVVRALVMSAIDAPAPDDVLVSLLELASKRAKAAALTRLDAELMTIIDRTRALRVTTPTTERRALRGLLRFYEPRETWESTLDTLESIARPKESVAVPEQARKLVWNLALGEHLIDIKPRLVAGKSIEGREVSLATLLKEPHDYLTDDDRNVLAHVVEEREDSRSYYGRGRVRYSLPRTALLGLVGHPNVVRSGSVPVEVVRGEVELRIDKQPDGGVSLSLEPAFDAASTVAFREDGPRRLVVYEATKSVTALATAIGAQGTRLPAEGVERFKRIVGGLLSHVRVTSTIGIDIDAEQITPDARPVVFLTRDGEGVRARIRVCPLGLDGPALEAGRGPTRIMSTREGRAVTTTRELAVEKRQVMTLFERCPTLDALPRDGDARVAVELETTLELLIELKALGDDIVVAFPDGRPLAAPILKQARDLRVRIGEVGDYLEIDASLPVDESTVVRMRALLDASRRALGRFIQLDDGRFLALTDDLRARLASLDAIGDAKDGHVRASPFMLPVLEELLSLTQSGTGSPDASALERLRAMAKALDKDVVKPRGFECDLRDYQLDGFRFLARLTEAGLGACLADDMGLGKTIQALALLVHRKKKGPALVVVPTTVLTNWIEEGARFAPSLSFSRFGDGDRDQALGALRPGHVLLMSYGMLALHADKLAQTKFATVVFDEAHMLKNTRSQRAKAAHALTADARVALTGTPIENHLGELFSLFQAIVPGLFGSEEAFTRKFTQPIADGDRERARVLRQILRPFVLRRTKTQVLTELPARTEITRRVIASDEERSFYEAVRRDAIERIEAARVGPEAQTRVRILAEIMRLRQASIDPRIVESASGISGAKLAALEELLTEARDEGHRVLVFSQFLGALSLVRALLEEMKVVFLELDGSTPPQERARRVAAFQSGEGDVFLMSLKAGGVGVNLTGADYVVHLDPWWNPAVEDQASDRAHRMGQTRPVTIYRLITAGTIEEKILALHGTKRALADDLLAGLDAAKPLDLAELRGFLDSVPSTPIEDEDAEQTPRKVASRPRRGAQKRL